MLLPMYFLLGILLVSACVTATRNVYIDLGANNGDSVTMFLNRFVANVSYSGDEKNIKSLKGSTSAVQNWELYVFEAHPKYSDGLKKQRESLLNNRLVSSFYLYTDTAISVMDGSTYFILDPEGWHEGSTLMSESQSAKGEVVKVKCIDIVTLFKDIGRFSTNDTVFVKMDIEGAEFPVVKRLLQYGLLDHITRIAIEW